MPKNQKKYRKHKINKTSEPKNQKQRLSQHHKPQGAFAGEAPILSGFLVGDQKALAQTWLRWWSSEKAKMTKGSVWNLQLFLGRSKCFLKQTWYSLVETQIFQRSSDFFCFYIFGSSLRPSWSVQRSNCPRLLTGGDPFVSWKEISVSLLQSGGKESGWKMSIRIFCGILNLTYWVTTVQCGHPTLCLLRARWVFCRQVPPGCTP